MLLTTSVNSYVQKLYQNVLQRTSDTSGLNFWTAQATGTTAADVAKAFIGSTEAQNVTAVLHLYDAFFNRAADSSGLKIWVSALNGGASLRDIANAFSSSSEFQTKFSGASTDVYVEAVHSNLFGRASDTAGKDYWVQKIDSGAMSRADVSLAFTLSDEAHTSTGAATRFTESYLALRAAGTTEPSTSAVEALAIKALDTALAEKITGYGANITGKLVDGNIAGAFVFADANGDGKFNAGEASTTTDAKGNFDLGDAVGGLVGSGGTDLSTGKAFQGVLKAAEGSTMINPLTSLQAAFIEKGLTAAQAQDKVAAAFGLDTSKFDLSTFDPLATSLDTNASPEQQALGAQLQAQAAKIANFLVAAGQTLVGAAGGADKLDLASVQDALLNSMINAISNDSDGAISLSDTAFLQGVMNASVSESGNADLIAAGDKVVGLADNFATMMAAAADNIDNALAAGGDITAIMVNVAQAQVTVQGDMLDKMVAAAEGSGDFSAFEDGFTGDAFDHAANSAVIGTIDPNNPDNQALQDLIDAANQQAGDQVAADSGSSTDTGSGGGGGSTPATFTVSIDANGIVSFGGTATGDIMLTSFTQGSFAATGLGTITVDRGGVSATLEITDALNPLMGITLAADQNFYILYSEANGATISGDGHVFIVGEDLVNGDPDVWTAFNDYDFSGIISDTTLVVAAADITGETIDFNGTVEITDLAASMDVDFSLITATSVTADYSYNGVKKR
jgi:hypothetical protein